MANVRLLAAAAAMAGLMSLGTVAEAAPIPASAAEVAGSSSTAETVQYGYGRNRSERLGYYGGFGGYSGPRRGYGGGYGRRRAFGDIPHAGFGRRGRHRGHFGRHFY